MPDSPQFYPVFRAESEEHLAALEQGLVRLEHHPDQLELVRELNRVAHTLKGSARVFGFTDLQEVAHRIEDIFDCVGHGQLAFTSDVANRVFAGLDVIRAMLGPTHILQLPTERISSVCQALEQAAGPVITPGKLSAASGAAAPAAPAESPRSEARQEAGDPAGQRSGPADEYVRVPVRRVNRLLNLVGEMVINKMKSSQKMGQMRRLALEAKEIQHRLTEVSERMRREGPSGQEEAQRGIGQCQMMIETLRQAALRLHEQFSSEFQHTAPVIDELQARMKDLRMLPCSTIMEGFPRMVRDIGAQQGKEVTLDVRGGDTELDRKVLEGIKGPLIHLLRNCIDHGIETPQVREASGKPRTGHIDIAARYEAGNVVITIQDDGRGISVDKVRETAARKRLVSPDDLAGMTPKEVLNLVFMNGYSTSPLITDLSGRGIGLDVVRRDLERLKGQVILETEAGRWTRFTLVLPLTIAIMQVLLVRSGGQLWSLPTSVIEQTLKVSLASLPTVEGRLAVHTQERTVPVVVLADVLGFYCDAEDGDPPAERPVIVTSSLEKRVGFVVDQIVGVEEIFVKNLGEHLGKVRMVSGAAILGTGQLVAILDVADLIAQSRLSHPAVRERLGLPKERRKQRRILVVDDAISTRELEKMLLETQGYLVETAVDGVDGLNKLSQQPFDLVVTDIQMPRMDGFEMCRILRSRDALRQLPVVMVTALERDEDKQRGAEVGAQAYIVKTSFDQHNLLDTIEQLLR